MKSRFRFTAAMILVVGLAIAPGFVCAQQDAGTKVATANDPVPTDAKSPEATASAASAASKLQDEDVLRIEGEKRFHNNCGRCHQAPHKFPPRMMATIVRHMRVRATITDEDMRVILHYMTQ